MLSVGVKDGKKNWNKLFEVLEACVDGLARDGNGTVREGIYREGIQPIHRSKRGKGSPTHQVGDEAEVKGLEVLEIRELRNKCLLYIGWELREWRTYFGWCCWKDVSICQVGKFALCVFYFCIKGIKCLSVIGKVVKICVL